MTAASRPTFMGTMSSERFISSNTRSEAIKPRLLNMRQVAAYRGCSFWTARDYILQGLIPVVDLPPLRPREGERPRKTLRRVLVDRADLDAFIEGRKCHTRNEPASEARRSHGVPI